MMFMKLIAGYGEILYSVFRLSYKLMKTGRALILLTSLHLNGGLMIYVDQLTNYGPRMGQWCHMATDGDLEELHALAKRIGLKRAWFQDHALMPHYDLNASKRVLAVKCGAVEMTGKDVFRLCRVRANDS